MQRDRACSACAELSLTPPHPRFPPLCPLPQASANGATGVELDLEFTADGIPVLMHDETVDRTTNGSGFLKQLRFADLSKLDAGARHRLR